MLSHATAQPLDDGSTFDGETVITTIHLSSVAEIENFSSADQSTSLPSNRAGRHGLVDTGDQQPRTAAPRDREADIRGEEIISVGDSQTTRHSSVESWGNGEPDASRSRNSRTRRQSDEGVNDVETGLELRPEYICAILNKESQKSELGISLETVDSTLKIDAIRRNGIVAVSKCLFRNGDTVISVNNLGCENMSHREAARLLRQAEGKVRIVVKTAGGDSRLVAATVSRPTRNHPTGITFTLDRSSGPTIQNIVREGLFGQSLLNAGDQVMAINRVSCSDMDASSASLLVATTPRFITILAKKNQPAVDRDAHRIESAAWSAGGWCEQCICGSCMFLILAAILIMIAYTFIFDDKDRILAIS